VAGEHQLSIVILAVDDLERARAFYASAFAASEVVSSPSYLELEIGGTTRLGLYERVAFGRNTGQVPPPLASGEISRTELYFRVADLPAAIAKLDAAGARLLSPAQDRSWGERAAYFADPDGNVIVAAVRI
jgi:catechol 2,3-dioxygenase-like lactoylglutathione lyase family enzyme